MKVEYSGFSITWNATLAGITVEAPCTRPGLNGAILKQHQLRTWYVTGVVRRKCIMADMWEENVICFTEDLRTTQILLDQVNVFTTISCV